MKTYNYFVPTYKDQDTDKFCGICGRNTDRSSKHSTFFLNEKSDWYDLPKDSDLYKLCHWFASKNNEKQRLKDEAVSLNRSSNFVQLDYRNFSLLEDILNTSISSSEKAKYITEKEEVCECGKTEWDCSNCGQTRKNCKCSGDKYIACRNCGESEDDCECDDSDLECVNCGESESYCNCSSTGYSCSNCEDRRSELDEDELDEDEKSCICDSDRRAWNISYDDEDDVEEHQKSYFSEIMSDISKVYSSHNMDMVAVSESDERYGSLQFGYFNEPNIAKLEVHVDDMEFDLQIEGFRWVGLKTPKPFWISTDYEYTNDLGLEEDIYEIVFPFDRHFYASPKVSKETYKISQLSAFEFKNVLDNLRGGSSGYDFFSYGNAREEDTDVLLKAFVDGVCVIDHPILKKKGDQLELNFTPLEYARDTDNKPLNYFSLINMYLRPFCQHDESFDLYYIDYLSPYREGTDMLLHVALVFEDMVVLICGEDFVDLFKKEISKDHKIKFKSKS